MMAGFDPMGKNYETETYSSDCKHRFLQKAKGRGQVGLAVFVLLSTSACFSTNNHEEYLWKPGNIHVAARQEVLETNVEEVGSQSRILRDRFDALERLYVDLVRTNKEQQEQIASLKAELQGLTGRAANNSAVHELSSDVNTINKTLKLLESRVFQVELGEAAAMKAATAALQEGGDQASTKGAAAAHLTNEADDQKPRYAIHLGSYRAKEQVPSSWEAFARVFAGELEGLEPRLYAQSQEGIGDFLRLVVGPFIDMAEAEAVCNRIKARAREQFCVATEFQGDPLF